MYRLPFRSPLSLRFILAPTKLARRTLTKQGALPVSPPLPPSPPPSESSSSVPPPPPPKSSTTSLGTTLLAVVAASALGYVFGSGFVGEEKKGAGAVASTSSSTYPPPFGSLADYQAGIDELKGIFAKNGRPDDVSTDPGDLEEHGFSAWSYHEEHRPNVVVWAESTEDVQRVVKTAVKYHIPVTPFAAGTSLEGHFSSPFGGISLDMSRMNKIIEIHEADGDMVVQPGIGWQDVNAELAKRGIKMFFPLDPAPGASIGGMAACGCSGTNAVRYGTAKAEWFLNLTVVLPSGEVIKTRQRSRKSSAGWDATKLFVGSEGTLGIITEATIRLTPLLPTKCAVVNFPNVKAAVSAATAVVNLGQPVQCVEFLDDLMMKAINQAGSNIQYPERDTLFFKFQGSDASMAEVSKSVETVVKQHGGKDFTFSKTDEEAAKLWEGRKAALWSAIALLPDHKCWTTDVCVPISALPLLVEETKADLLQRGLTACHVGHVGDGNVHSLILFKDDEELERVKQAVHEMVHRAQRLGGTATGEHGVGIGKIEYLEAELGKGTVALMEDVKKTIDPYGIMNPGKLYPNLSPTLAPHAH
ncbi:putative D-lactate dehydrogenase cytochrome oxidoreductase protein [Mrakia frigida]|uniref:FAD-binding oxidoreductase n=1 Tax=Mrakia frigida TaxID=29902 RepID=UPI003FCC2158